MTLHLSAALLAIVCGAAAPALAQQSEPVLVPTPGATTRSPVSTAPAQPEKPVKVDVSDESPAPRARSESPGKTEAPGKSDARDEAGQRGGGSSRGGGRRGPPDGAWRGNSYPRGSSRAPWMGTGWPAPVYAARPYYYDPFWASGAFAWSPLFYAPWSLMWGTAGYWPGPWLGSTTFDTGRVRLKLKPREAQVWVDGFYAGLVDEFDGVFQSLRLAPGGHKIEVRSSDFETLTFDVHVQPDRTMTLTEMMKVTP